MAALKQKAVLEQQTAASALGFSEGWCTLFKQI